MSLTGRNSHWQVEPVQSRWTERAQFVRVNSNGTIRVSFKDEDQDVPPHYVIPLRRKSTGNKRHTRDPSTSNGLRIRNPQRATPAQPVTNPKPKTPKGMKRSVARFIKWDDKARRDNAIDELNALGVWNECTALIRHERDGHQLMRQNWEEKLEQIRVQDEDLHKWYGDVAKRMDDDEEKHFITDGKQDYRDMVTMIRDYRAGANNFRTLRRDWDIIALVAEMKEIVTTGGLDRQHATDLRDLYNQCAGHQAEFNRICNGFKKKQDSRGADIEVQIPAMKGDIRAMYKLVYKYGGDCNELKDILRASIVFDRFDDIYNIGVPMVRRAFGGIVRVKDKFRKAPKDQYGDILLNVRVGGKDGVLCEIQLQLRDFLNERRRCTRPTRSPGTSR